MFDVNLEIKRVIEWLRAFMEAENKGGLVYGLSGGIDSAVATTLAVNALGRERVFGVIMPCHSNSKDQEDAILLAKWLGIQYRIVDLSQTYDVMCTAADRVLHGNTRSRLRMIELYATVEDFNVKLHSLGIHDQDWIVGGTTNQSELMTGYFTKWGDGGVDIEPLLDYYKDEIYAFAHAIPGFPQVIVDRIPTAGYHPTQTDEGEMGISYPRLNAVLRAMKSNSIEFAALPMGDVAHVLKLIQNSAHKRKPIPHCPRDV